jgi:hypothetical protein
MTAYRLYYFDGVGRVAAAKDLESDTDDAAILMAGRYANGQSMEIWRQDQFVGCPSPQQPKGLAAGSHG